MITLLHDSTGAWDQKVSNKNMSIRKLIVWSWNGCQHRKKYLQVASCPLATEQNLYYSHWILDI